MGREKWKPVEVVVAESSKAFEMVSSSCAESESPSMSLASVSALSVGSGSRELARVQVRLQA